MMVLGLAGAAGSGKDTVASYLVHSYGFVSFAFSDALYREVQEAYGLPDQLLLRDRTTKERPTGLLSVRHCRDSDFGHVVLRELTKLDLSLDCGLSPRQILQWWGTQYRRAQNPSYWLDRATKFIVRMQSTRYPEHAPQYFVETGTRFENERASIRSAGGNIWHIHRDAITQQDSHASAQALSVLDGERELWNNDTIERLYRGVDLLMTTQARFVRVEPMDPIVALQADGVTLAGGEETE